MRQFAAGGFRIWNLSREAKVVYTCFCVFSLLALASSAALYEDLVGGGTRGIRAYYAGEDAQPDIHRPPAEAKGAHEPTIDLPPGLPQDGVDATGDEDAPRLSTSERGLTVAASYRKLLEVTHFHLYSVPVFLLIITHLFMLTGWSSRVKIVWILGGWLSALAHLAAPWLVHYGGGRYAWTYAASGAALALTTSVLTVYPVWAMWMVRPPARRSSSSEASSDSSSSTL